MPYREPRADYTIAYCDSSQVLIIDTNKPGSRSVTNDAENVVKRLEKTLAHDGGLKGRRLYYQDSEGQIDEMRCLGGKFIGYKFTPQSQRDHLRRLADIQEQTA